ncbi:hypothetical protein L226DRAFT_22812 [Lentinus tigrinus ALCF2SS1-7]|uniref:uncharacterized protein n=1 Tax=Lentinus tigrinus ALCF2SS1-7 TaxID=1328758 RepID=UPI00116606C2|nr:hypothetical protein L226DRAFT_22812 [Lentinus tigrinus ALCF2SS1-7]
MAAKSATSGDSCMSRWSRRGLPATQGSWCSTLTVSFDSRKGYILPGLGFSVHSVSVSNRAPSYVQTHVRCSTGYFAFTCSTKVDWNGRHVLRNRALCLRNQEIKRDRRRWIKNVRKEHPTLGGGRGHTLAGAHVGDSPSEHIASGARITMGC